MFKRIADAGRDEIGFSFEGRPLRACAGDTVAAALLLAGEGATRETPVSGQSRGPYCLMGVCFECLVEIDGVPNRQSCMTLVTEGMTVRRQRGAAERQE